MAFTKRTINDTPLDGATVLVRVDYNVPLLPDGTLNDDFRIRANVPALQNLLGRHCRVVIISHLGRPEGVDPQLSLRPIAKHLSELLGQPVTFVDECVGPKVAQVVKKAPLGSVILLENLRFHPEEEANDEAFAKELVRSSGARYFVQDGFGVVYRAHASTDAITHCIPSVAGLLLAKECRTISSAMERPKRPFVAVIGGAKISDKIGIIERFVDKADTIIVGGAMANTFLKYKGHAMGASVSEDGQEKTLDSLYLKAHKKHEINGKKHISIEDFIVLPSDVAVAEKIDAQQPRRTVWVGDIHPGDIALDIGEASIERMIDIISKAGTVVWNGPLGYAELPHFAHGSARLALALASQPHTTSVVGGGDTADFVLKWDNYTGDGFTHISTGGGASLALMGGEKLPGVEGLLDGPR